jgi:membrane protease YdiL (CAAX protease family)
VTDLSTERSMQPIAGSPAVGRRGVLIPTAWVATLLLSKLPLVIARDLLGGDIPWIAAGWIGAAALLLGSTYAWPTLRALRGYFALMGLILLLGNVFDPLIRQTGLWTGLVTGRSEITLVLLDRVMLILQTLIVLGTVLLMGTSRRSLFLTAGDLTAPLGGRAASDQMQQSEPGLQPATTAKRRLTWALLGPGLALVLGGLFFAFLSGQNPAALSDLTAVIPWLPLILLSATLNAFGEEGMYRAGPLSALLRAVGPRHALWLAAIWFGLGHYYGGTPSGVFGFVQTGLLGLLLGKAMLDTRGMGWPWIIHVVLDTIIYFFVAATMG